VGQANGEGVAKKLSRVGTPWESVKPKKKSGANLKNVLMGYLGHLKTKEQKKKLCERRKRWPNERGGTGGGYPGGFLHLKKRGVEKRVEKSVPGARREKKGVSGWTGRYYPVDERPSGQKTSTPRGIKKESEPRPNRGDVHTATTPFRKPSQQGGKTGQTHTQQPRANH